VLTFDPAYYGETAASLLRAAPLCELGPGTENSAVRSVLRSLDDATLFPEGTVSNRDMAACCVSGLWLLHNFLDESHRISQGIATVSGSYWHGIMHRRQPDFSNAKYWFRRVGNHPVYPSLWKSAKTIAADFPQDDDAVRLAGASSWDAFSFVDLCESSLRGSAPYEPFCRSVAQAEWQLLFDYCYRQACAT